ncbi:MAG TPA: MBL fold metallo-hydrolase [Ktedonobacterales bacterium]|nr:MBL fold metallo-hydrolase [Ktedonobacterales bacterium]
MARTARRAGQSRQDVTTPNGRRSRPAARPADDGRATHDEAAYPRLTARFWGVRGSHPAPFATGSRFGGNTACVELRFGRHLLIFDAGSGIVGLGDALAREWHDRSPAARPTLTLLFTHAHHDHLCGLPFFAPLFEPGADVHLVGPDLAGLRFEQIVAGYMRTPYFPVDFYDLPSRRHLRSISDGARLVWTADGDSPVTVPQDASIPPDALVVDVLHTQLHPREGTLVYRATGGGRSLVFATDVEVGERGGAGERRFVRFVRGADVLVHDAQYSDEDYDGATPHRGFGHSTPAMAARVARAAEVDRLILFHHDPNYPDADVLALERAARQLFPRTWAAREGGEIWLDGQEERHV